MSVIEKLTADMKKAAKELDFESAADNEKLTKIINNLKNLKK